MGSAPKPISSGLLLSGSFEDSARPRMPGCSGRRFRLICLAITCAREWGALAFDHPSYSRQGSEGEQAKDKAHDRCFRPHNSFHRCFPRSRFPLLERGEDAGRTYGAGTKESSVGGAQLGAVGYLGSGRSGRDYSKATGNGDRIVTRGGIQLGHDRRDMMFGSAG
jgi:hypothetical protein